MPINRNLLIVIADGEHASFFRPAPHNAVRRDETFDAINAHKRSADLGSDHPGDGFHTGSSAHHALAPQHDPHTLEKEKFGRLVAQQLNEAAAQDVFDQLVIVSPAHTLHVIQAELDHMTAAMIVGTFAKDLVGTPDHELWAHLRSTIPLTSRRARSHRAIP